MGVSKKTDTAIGMGVAVTFVIALASIITYFIQIILDNYQLGYLQTIAFILVIASIVQFVEMVIKKTSPSGTWCFLTSYNYTLCGFGYSYS